MQLFFVDILHRRTFESALKIFFRCIFHCKIFWTWNFLIRDISIGRRRRKMEWIDNIFSKLELVYWKRFVVFRILIGWYWRKMLMKYEKIKTRLKVLYFGRILKLGLFSRNKIHFLLNFKNIKCLRVIRETTIML